MMRKFIPVPSQSSGPSITGAAKDVTTAITAMQMRYVSVLGNWKMKDQKFYLTLSAWAHSLNVGTARQFQK